jgi:Protoglobin
MNQSQNTEPVRMVADQIAGYSYGSCDGAKSPITLHEFELLKQTAGFTKEDERWLHVAGEVLADQTKALVGTWREVIANHPHLAKYSQRLDGQKDPRYSEGSGLRFQPWVLGIQAMTRDRAAVAQAVTRTSDRSSSARDPIRGKGMVTKITRQELKEKLDYPRKSVLLEALTPEEYRLAHLPGALNMPPDQVRTLAPELIPKKD